MIFGVGVATASPGHSESLIGEPAKAANATRVGADAQVSHRADRILSQVWKPTLRWSAVDKCSCQCPVAPCLWGLDTVALARADVTVLRADKLRLRLDYSCLHDRSYALEPTVVVDVTSSHVMSCRYLRSAGSIWRVVGYVLAAPRPTSID